MNEIITKLLSELDIDEQQKKTIIMALSKKSTAPTDDSTVALAASKDDEKQKLAPEQTMTRHPPSTSSSGISEELEQQIGKYTVSKRLGIGGSGTVYRVRDPDLNRDIALKVPHAEILSTFGEAELFIREAHICAQLQHPGIVPVHEIKEDEIGRPYFTMREIQGENLQKVIKKLHLASDDREWGRSEDGWTFKKVINVVIKVCETLSYAHSKGVIHQDIKPGNIMVGSFGVVSVVDWGIARCTIPDEIITDVPHELLEGTIVGTPQFMSPEQASGQDCLIDARSDVYSLGAMLYLLLTGKSLYQGDPFSIVQQILSIYHTPSFPDLLPERIPEELARITLRAIAHSQENRYQSVQELQADLASWLEGSKKTEKAHELLRQIETYTQEEEGLQQELTDMYSMMERLSAQINSLDQLFDVRKQYIAKNELLRELQNQREQAIFRALIHAPHMHKIHKQIIQIEMEKYKRFWILDDKNALLQTQKKIEIHLQELPLEETRAWEQFQQRQRDTINILRRQKGPYFGSRSLLRNLLSRLQENSFIALQGEAGIGKTRLALEIAALWRDEHEAESYFCNMQNCTSLFQVYQVIASKLGILLQGATSWEPIKAALKNRKGILILDNIDTLHHTLAQLLEEFLLCGQQTKWILTTQKEQNIPKEALEKILPISISTSLDLFLEKAEKSNSSLTFSLENQHQYLDIVRFLGGNPLCIEICTARLSIVSLQELHSLIKKQEKTAQDMGLQSTLLWSWELLSPETQITLTQCSLFKNGFSLEAALAILAPEGRDAAYVIDQLDTLFQAHFIQKEYIQEKTRYNLLPSLMRFAQQQFEKRGDDASIKKRFGAYYAQAYQKPCQKENNAQYWKERLVELDNIKASMEYGSISSAQTCAEIVYRTARTRVPPSLLIQTIDRFLTRLKPEKRDQNIMILKKLDLLHQLDRVEEIEQIEKRILPYLEKPNVSPLFLALWYRNKAEQKRAQDKNDEAIVLFKQAREIYEKESLVTEMIYTSLDLSGCYREERDFDAAQEKALEAIALAKQIGATHLLANPLMKIGIIHKERNELDAALEYYRQSLHYNQFFSNDLQLAYLFTNTGNIYRKQGKLKKAVQDYKKALQLNARLGNINSPLIIQNNLGMTYQAAGKHEEALGILQGGLRSTKKEKNPYVRAIILNNIATSMMELEDFENTERYLRQAEELLKEINRPLALGGTYTNFATLYLKQNDVSQASKYVQYSVDTIKDSFPYVQGLVQIIFGQIYTKEKKFDKAEAAFLKAEELLAKNSTQSDMLKTLQHKALLYAVQKDAHSVQKTLDRMSAIIDTFEEEVQRYQRKKHKELEMKVQKELIDHVLY